MNSKRSFNFGNGEQGTATGTAMIPLATPHVQPMPISVMDAKAPPLLGVNLLHDTEAIVRFGSNPTITYHGGEGPTQDLLKLPSGHLALKVVADAATEIDAVAAEGSTAPSAAPAADSSAAPGAQEDR